MEPSQSWQLSFCRLSGWANLGSAMGLGAFWFLYVALLPYNELTSSLSVLVLDADWRTVNVIGALGATLGLLGLPGIFVRQAHRVGRLGLVGFLFAMVGCGWMLGPLLWDTIVWLPLARYDSAILDFDGPIYASSLFIPFFVASGLVWALGFCLIGMATVRARVLPKMAGYAVAVGAPLFGLGALFGPHQAVPRTIGISLFVLGIAWIGRALLKPRDGHELANATHLGTTGA